MKSQDIARIIGYNLTQAIYAKHDSLKRDQVDYWQGRIDVCNDMLAALGHSRLDSSDEMMLVQRRVTAHSVQRIMTKKAPIPPPAVYN